MRATIDLGLDGERFTVRIDRGALAITAGAPERSDLSLTCEVDTLIGFLRGAPVPAAALAPARDLALLDRLPAIFAFAAEAPSERVREAGAAGSA